jgi:hypothetical protein
MRAVALTAHGLCDLQQAEALVLDWFESEGLELVHGQDGVMIGWSEASLTPLSSVPSLAVEVRFYELGGGWLQARWSLRLAQGEALQAWAEELIDSLKRRLRDDPLWQVDGP